MCLTDKEKYFRNRNEAMTDNHQQTEERQNIPKREGTLEVLLTCSVANFTESQARQRLVNGECGAG